MKYAKSTYLQPMLLELHRLLKNSVITVKLKGKKTLEFYFYSSATSFSSHTIYLTVQELGRLKVAQITKYLLLHRGLKHKLLSRIDTLKHVGG